MNLDLYQVDAFTPRVFRGNPAAVVPLTEWLPDAIMQAIAAENNLAETAFYVPQGEDFGLRWFTPTVEVDLCGHATLATAYVVFHVRGYDRSAVTFHTRSGPLEVRPEGERLVMNFPASPATPATEQESRAVATALRAEPVVVVKGNFPLAVFQSEAEVAALRPDFAYMAELPWLGICCAAAPGRDVDFVSRFFAPAAGIPEDPVTGAAHCLLAPYWAKELGRKELRGRQISQRTGEVTCVDLGERVSLSGEAALYLSGTIVVPDDEQT